MRVFDRNVEQALREFEGEEEQRIAAAASAAAALATSTTTTAALAAGAAPPGALTAPPAAAGSTAGSPATAGATPLSAIGGVGVGAAGHPAPHHESAPGESLPNGGTVATLPLLPSFSLATLSQHLFGTVTGGPNGPASTGATSGITSAGGGVRATAPPVPPRTASQVNLAVAAPPPATASAREPAPMSAPTPALAQPSVPAPGSTEERALLEDYEMQLAMAISLSVKEAQAKGIPIPPDTPDDVQRRF